MKNKIYLLFAILLMAISPVGAQDLAYENEQILVQVKPGFSIVDVLNELSYYKGEVTQVKVDRLLSTNLNAYQLSFNSELISHSAMLALARNISSVEAAQYNYIIEKRLIPNDTSYAQQWQYEQASDFDLDAQEAWDITTGGVTALGDTIVVCVIDDGLEVSHPDWGDNIWYNQGEIFGNGIDDDGNGYVDDYRGWNADNNNNNILPPSSFNTHGTPVAGIVGAQGNNNVGVTGVNWDVKVMFVIGGGNNAAAIAAYDYPLSCRKLYNQTNGASGAFVVATNSSWGINNLDCSTYAPLVNNMYDSLGAEGVLSAAATANANINVDAQGDFPTSCTSDYMIAVTNMQQNGNKVFQAGYGATQIDLGAYGEGTYTIAYGQTYGAFGGTSGATPHVAGTIGLLYSAPCGRLASLARSQPGQTALLIKDILLNTTVPHPTLQNITVSEGVLNMKNALDSAMNIGCSLAGCHEPYMVSSNNITGTNADVYWEKIDSTTKYYVRYKPIGSSAWILTSVTDTFALLAGLTQCTKYEFEVAANCDSTKYSNTHVFKTGDCCDAPLSVQILKEEKTSATIGWLANPIATTYLVEYKLKNDTVWNSVTTANDSLVIAGLDSCSIYEIRIQSSCAINVNNNYSVIEEFETKGCGSCSSVGYCSAQAGSANDEWIESVTLSNIVNVTGSSNGYVSFVNSGPTTDLTRGATYPISIDIGFNLGGWGTDWRLKVWIDFNQDQKFDSSEVVFDPGQISTATVTHAGNIVIPNNAELNRTRMRVGLRWGTNDLMPCDDPNFGEIEDYCVNIVKYNNVGLNENGNISQFKVYPNPFEDRILIEFNQEKEQEVEILITKMTGQVVKAVSKPIIKGNSRVDLSNLDLPSGMYLLVVNYESGVQQAQKIVKY